MGKQSIDTGFRLGRIEDQLRLAVLLQNGVVVIHDHRSVSIAVGRSPDPEDGKVEAECQKSSCQDRDQRRQEEPPQSFPEVRA